MEKYLSIKFIILLGLAIGLFIVHELGHWLAYRIFGFEARVRKSIVVPGIDPKEDLEVSRVQGITIALSGFLFSTVVVILPLYLGKYNLWFALFLGGIAGASIDFLWAISMLFQKKITIYSNNRRRS